MALDDDVPPRRVRWGVVIPSTNTEVEHDLGVLRPPEVTMHVARMRLDNPDLSSDAAFLRTLETLRTAARDATNQLAALEPDRVLFGTTAETFWGGPDGNARFTAELQAIAGAPVTTGATAIEEALHVSDARRVAVLTPYQAVMDQEVLDYLAAIDIDVLGLTGLRCPDAFAIARLSPKTISEELAALDGADVQALLVLGTNVPLLHLTDELQRCHGKPVIGVNAALVASALRSDG